MDVINLSIDHNQGPNKGPSTNQAVSSSPNKNNMIISEEEKSKLERIMDSNIPKGIVDIIDQVPQDVKQLTIRNLDTGEEFVIGETDPDFDFDTFELGARRGRNESVDTNVAATTPINEVTSDKAVNDTATEIASEIGSDEKASPRSTASKPVRKGVLSRLYNYFFSSSSNSATKSTRATDSNHSSADALGAEKPFKTPFTKLSSFKFRRELGRGAFGRVLLAQAKVDGQLYALKIISKKDMRTSDKRQAKAERDILHAMGHTAPHPFTAGLRFAFQSVNHLYLGMDYFPGGNLRELIKKYGSLPEDWVRFYATELVLAISHMHSLNVLYRDIKPHNVMLDARGHIVLIDFGLSKQEISHPRGAMSLVGTPDYSAPEVLKTGVYQIEQYNKQKVDAAAKKDKHRGGNKGRRDNRTNSSDEISSPKPLHIGYGKAADWWSVGVMIYEMLGGTPAFRGVDLRETYQKVLFGELEFKPSEKFSGPARELISGLLRRDPSLRLGAWASPPTDLMRQTFFAGVNWDAALRKESDGPWVPEPVHYPLPQVAGASAATEAVGGLMSPKSPVAELGAPLTATATATTTTNNNNSRDEAGAKGEGALAPTATTSPTLTAGILTTQPGVKQAQLLTADMNAERAMAVLKSGGSATKPSPAYAGVVSSTSKQQPQYVFRSPVTKEVSAAPATPATIDTCLSDVRSPVLSPTETTDRASLDNQENRPANTAGPTGIRAVSTDGQKPTPKFTQIETKDEVRRLSLDHVAAGATDTVKRDKTGTPEPDEDELVPNRDSIFISGSASHAVADWSFVDVRAIRLAMSSGSGRPV